MDEPRTNVIPFPRPHRGDPDPRREALAQIGFRWTGGAWRRGRVVLTDDALDQMGAHVGGMLAALDAATAATALVGRPSSTAMSRQG